jgi:hypothetical protein
MLEPSSGDAVAVYYLALVRVELEDGRSLIDLLTLSPFPSSDEPCYSRETGKFGPQDEG